MPSEPSIDEHLFVEILALNALEMKFQDPQPSQTEKIIVLIDCMNNSDGPFLLQQRLKLMNPVDLLSNIKIRYAHLFQDT